ncbi:MAG: hypothetical protein DPW09_23490 [Anaerolineae bacterium]|nr:hypothetical protein [Anaerolineales bacterium]MCQ3976405.1 hypothetical protein [Anaerolineae bacterium]
MLAHLVLARSKGLGAFGLFADVLGFKIAQHTQAHRQGHCGTAHPDYFPFLRNGTDWVNLHTLVMVRAERRLPDKTSVEYRYYLSSLTSGAKRHLGRLAGVSDIYLLKVLFG